MMVCPYDETRLLLILQVDHSRVTGWFAAHWGNDTFARPSPYAAMVLAAQEHDTGWWDWEIKPTLDPDGRRPASNRNTSSSRAVKPCRGGGCPAMAFSSGADST